MPCTTWLCASGFFMYNILPQVKYILFIFLCWPCGVMLVFLLSFSDLRNFYLNWNVHAGKKNCLKILNQCCKGQYEWSLTGHLEGMGIVEFFLVVILFLTYVVTLKIYDSFLNLDIIKFKLSTNVFCWTSHFTIF